MRHLIGVMVFAFILCGLGCMAGGTKQLAAPGTMEKVQPGQSKVEVKMVLGEPAGITPLPEGEIWTYNYFEVQAKGASFIPVVGLFAGGTTGMNKTVSVLFNNAGKVAKVSGTQQDLEGGPLGRVEVKNRPAD